MSAPLVPDLGQARAYLTALTGEDDPTVTFQTFDDDEKRKSRKLARVLHGRLGDHADTLASLNNLGAGVFVMVNAGDGKGRTTKNVVGIRAFYMDHDKPKTRPYHKPATFTVHTSPGKEHGYFVLGRAHVDPLPIFSKVQKALATYYGADLSVTDLCRVMRLPGYHHMKKKPVLVTFEPGSGHRFDLIDISMLVPTPEEKPAPAKAPPHPKPTTGSRREKLVAIVRAKAEARSWTEGDRHASAKATTVHARKLGLSASDIVLIVSDLLVAAGKTEAEAEELVEWAMREVEPDPKEAERPKTTGADTPPAAPAEEHGVDDEEGDDEEDAPAADEPGRDGAAKRLIKIGEANSLLFHDERETPHAAIGTDDARRIVAVRSETFTTFLAGRYYLETGRAANSEAITGARRVLSHKAVFDGPRHPLHNRFAFRDGALWLDMANEKQEAVKVTADGWTVERPPILFRRFPRQAALPKPATSGDVRKLSGFINTRTDQDGLLALVWPIAAVLGHIPRPVLDFHGPHGSAKTTAARMLRRLTDPSVVKTLRLSERDDELALCLETNAVPLFDNVSHISARQADLLCTGVTGGGFSKRGLYTDSDEVLYDFRRAIIITGVNVATVAPDLLDRFLLLQLDRLDPTERGTEDVLWLDFEAAAPVIFAGMLDVLSKAMKLYQGIAQRIKHLQRMADFSLWGAAIAEALGFGVDAFSNAYSQNVAAQTEEVLEADPVARAVCELAGKRVAWTGTASELQKLLRETHADEAKTDGWPKRADGLSRRLRTLHSTLADVGISVRWSRGSTEARVRTVTIQMTAEDRPKAASKASTASKGAMGAPLPLDATLDATFSDASSREGPPVAGMDALDALDAEEGYPSGCVEPERREAL